MEEGKRYRVGGENSEGGKGRASYEGEFKFKQGKKKSRRGPAEYPGKKRGVESTRTHGRKQFKCLVLDNGNGKREKGIGRVCLKPWTGVRIEDS